jgi:hypothetical protein
VGTQDVQPAYRPYAHSLQSDQDVKRWIKAKQELLDGLLD